MLSSNFFYDQGKRKRAHVSPQDGHVGTIQGPGGLMHDIIVGPWPSEGRPAAIIFPTRHHDRRPTEKSLLLRKKKKKHKNLQ